VIRRLLSLSAAVTLLYGCVHGLEPLPLAITVVSSDTTVAASDTVQFLVKSTGRQLTQVSIDFGDATSDFVQAPAPSNRIDILFKHPYAAPGTYDAIATVLDSLQGAKSANLQITVQ